MNILPLVLGFLLLFSFLSYSFVQESFSTRLEETNYTGYMTAQRNARNKIEQKKYTRIVKAASKAKAKAANPTAKKDSSRGARQDKRRTPEVPYEASKFNFAILLKEKEKPVSPFLYETTAALLRTLYQKASFYKPDLEYRLLDVLISNGRTKSGVESLSDLYPDDKELKAVFYKMLKGTKTYDVKKGKGYASLFDFVSFDASKKEAVSFHFASPPVLTALFGEKTTENILTLEKNKRDQDNKEHALSKQEITALISQNQSSHFQLTDIERFFSFSKKYDKLTTVAGKEDTKSTSGIVIKRKF